MSKIGKSDLIASLLTKQPFSIGKAQDNQTQQVASTEKVSPQGEYKKKRNESARRNAKRNHGRQKEEAKKTHKDKTYDERSIIPEFLLQPVPNPLAEPARQTPFFVSTPSVSLAGAGASLIPTIFMKKGDDKALPQKDTDDRWNTEKSGRKFNGEEWDVFDQEYRPSAKPVSIPQMADIHNWRVGDVIRSSLAVPLPPVEGPDAEPIKIDGTGFPDSPVDLEGEEDWIPCTDAAWGKLFGCRSLQAPSASTITLTSLAPTPATAVVAASVAAAPAPSTTAYIPQTAAYASLGSVLNNLSFDTITKPISAGSAWLVNGILSGTHAYTNAVRRGIGQEPLAEDTAVHARIDHAYDNMNGINIRQTGAHFARQFGEAFELAGDSLPAYTTEYAMRYGAWASGKSADEVRIAATHSNLTSFNGMQQGLWSVTSGKEEAAYTMAQGADQKASQAAFGMNLALAAMSVGKLLEMGVGLLPVARAAIAEGGAVRNALASAKTFFGKAPDLLNGLRKPLTELGEAIGTKWGAFKQEVGALGNFIDDSIRGVPGPQAFAVQSADDVAVPVAKAADEPANTLKMKWWDDFKEKIFGSGNEIGEDQQSLLREMKKGTRDMKESPFAYKYDGKLGAAEAEELMDDADDFVSTAKQRKHEDAIIPIEALLQKLRNPRMQEDGDEMASLINSLPSAMDDALRKIRVLDGDFFLHFKEFQETLLLKFVNMTEDLAGYKTPPDWSGLSKKLKLENANKAQVQHIQNKLDGVLKTLDENKLLDDELKYGIFDAQSIVEYRNAGKPYNVTPVEDARALVELKEALLKINSDHNLALDIDGAFDGLTGFAEAFPQEALYLKEVLSRGGL